MLFDCRSNQRALSLPYGSKGLDRWKNLVTTIRLATRAIMIISWTFWIARPSRRHGGLCFESEPSPVVGVFRIIPKYT